MADDFPTEFDVVVIGTGLPESILAAAFSRIGQRVLHIDRNGYYSGRWCSFNLQGIESWKKQTDGEDSLQSPDTDTLKTLITEDENKIDLQLVDNSYSHVNKEINIGDEEETDETINQNNQENVSSVENEPKHVDSLPNKEVDKTPNGSEGQNQDVNLELSTDKQENEKEATNQSSDSGTSDSKDVSGEPESKDLTGTSDSKDVSSEPESKDPTGTNDSKVVDKESESIKDTVPNQKNKEKWTRTRLLKEWRKFNLDLTPKLLYCGGSMVQLLITSDIAKYTEFKTVTRMLTLLDDKLEKVPCSRADVFNSKEVSMLEKRMLMKFLTSCSEYDKNPADYQDFTNRPFTDYLESKKLTKNIKHFVQHSIAMATNQTLTPEGLARTKKFLHSLGRYGNTAFLWPLYGCGELPQSFCRMSAVFGGVYCLKMSASHLVVDKEKKCNGVITTDGKKISAKYVIIEESSIPSSLFITTNKRYISRAVLITDRSMLTDVSQQLSLLQIPDQTGKYLTTVIELPPSSMSSPAPLHVVHVTMETEDNNTTPETDLQETITKLFQKNPTTDDGKPVIMWALYFKRQYYSDVSVDRNIIPDNVIVIPGPGPEIDIDCVVDQTKAIFEQLMPGEDFLPRPPNPEDIIYIDDAENTVPDGANQSDFSDNSTDQSSANKETKDQSETENSNQSEQTSADNQLETDKNNQTGVISSENKSEQLQT